MAKTSIAALGLLLKRNFKSRPAGQQRPLVESDRGIRRWWLLASQVLQISPIVNILQASVPGNLGGLTRANPGHFELKSAPTVAVWELRNGP